MTINEHIDQFSTQSLTALLLLMPGGAVAVRSAAPQVAILPHGLIGSEDPDEGDRDDDSISEKR